MRDNKTRDATNLVKSEVRRLAVEHSMWMAAYSLFVLMCR